MSEPEITINGTELSEGQAMTIRVALETFALTLTDEGLGTDGIGEALCKGYLARVDDIRRMIFKVP